ncbi:MAG TPA: hypothetical protein VNC40_15355 [Gaiellaceae bacterium]|nr:hypothetical protein [Gaiellaceae bacterium]
MKRLTVVLAAALVLAPTAAARTSAGPQPYRVATTAPQGLRAFLLRPDELPQTYYPRTPSFTWTPVAQNGGTYDFELSTSRSFDDSSVLFSYTKLAIPALAIAHQLPWMTGQPYALWAHVRWESKNGKTVTPWSTPFGFNMRWTNSDYPTQLPAPEGLIRWKPIAGATRYEVLYPDLNGAQSFQTTTNVADEREWFTFHDTLATSTWATVHWRVRAIRYIDDKDLLKNGLPRASYGPWSPVFSTVNPPLVFGTLAPTATISDTWDKVGQPAQPHELMPGFAWSSSAPVLGNIGSFGSSLYRVYIFTDDHCVNQVFAGSVVGSPAFAPRTVGGPLALPQSTKTLSNWMNPPYLLARGDEGNAFDATGQKVLPNELPAQTAAGGAGSGDANVDLWDSGWPTGRYYWTVVPVTVSTLGVYDPTAQDQPIQYHDAAVPQDECEAGLGMSFGKVSQPVVTAAGNLPWVSGLAPDGRVIASASKVPQVHDSPLVAWEPAVGATTYEVQLSRTSYPWRTTWSTSTAATSVVLPIGSTQVGSWYYRVRGVNPALPVGAQEMSWSNVVRLRITGDRFVLVK